MHNDPEKEESAMTPSSTCIVEVVDIDGDGVGDVLVVHLRYVIPFLSSIAAVVAYLQL